ncbi:ParB/RepB/Spo0J family plasmid partition protein [Salmonella enterica subsp. enterica serovar Oranienburg]|uniref:ParB/RepB/Spo0J family plasmid partition protein n=1 Tax=Salmonella enterica subsp. enterica serovar Napoli TaxID=1151001 RepID=A0A702WAB5_SALET|nr:ParB/RepB/Spo0J family plasmid partition protein [Salmonella enterica subsp. enterica serovar Bispebjerg]EBY0126989.1 ParB/RepB/Spo0J family plasmid partition protein [Salmonella enterica subsp. enterica serovar Vitkin]EBY4132631.1 ParB/RepB/Spo0J family plasmid partition protein [Salmonella enterica subsp. enterica serovar Oranienburg]ECC1695655.1 ParB/RepB/Spo0J family plasmid partition protein [Salmonella enterica subsp. salamae]ECL7395303.1 ParB/RepB/Spo0J family plasmid partition protei
MKQRSILKNAPNIETLMSNTHHAPQKAQSISPMVGDLQRQLNSLSGNSITLPVCGRSVTFKLETIPADKVEMATMVWLGNERDQELLNESALADLIPSFLTSGQQNPAFARKISGIIEVADGSRRRKAAIITGTDYRVLVGELDDEQMQWLSQVGNDYRPTSAYERGKRYQRRLNDFDGNVKALAEAEGIDRNIITRCINTAGLPKSIIAIFQHPGELSARAGNDLFKVYQSNEKAMLDGARQLLNMKQAGEILEPARIIQILHDVIMMDKQEPPKTEKTYGDAVVAKYKGNFITLKLDNRKIPSHLMEKIEALLESELGEAKS